MSNFKFTGDLGIMQGTVFALIVAAAAWFLYYRQIRQRSNKDKMILPTLRAAAIFLLVIMLTQPVIHHRKIIGELGRLFVVVDSSRSMVLKDVETENWPQSFKRHCTRFT